MRARLFALLLLLFTLLATAAATSAATPAPDDAWLDSVDEAVKQASASDRYIIVDLYADWCGWCKVLESKVFTSPTFRTFAADYVLLRVDVEDGGEGSALQTRFEANSLPTTLIVDKNLVRIGTVPGYAPTAQFIAMLQKEIKSYDAFLDYYRKARHSDDPQVLRQLAEELHSRTDGVRAAEIYQQVARALPAGSIQSAWLRYLTADAFRLGHAYTKAEESLAQARREAAKLGDEELLERADLLRYNIAQDSGNCKQAVSSLESFLATHPQSTFSRQARRTLAALKGGAGTICA